MLYVKFSMTWHVCVCVCVCVVVGLEKNCTCCFSENRFISPLFWFASRVLGSQCHCCYSEYFLLIGVDISQGLGFHKLMLLDSTPMPTPKRNKAFHLQRLMKEKTVKHYRFWSLLKGLISFWGVGIGPNNVLGHIAATRSRWIFYHYWIRPPNGKELDISTGLWTNSFWTYTVAQYKDMFFLGDLLS